MILEGQELTPELLVQIESMVNEPQNPVRYLGIDPGGSNGICGYDAKFYLLFMVTVKADDMNKFLNQFKRIIVCVIEDFTLFAHKAIKQSGSDMQTSRVIGNVETWAENGGVRLVKQPSRIKTTGYKWIGKKPLPKSNPANHSLDAHVHFMYWAVRTKKLSLSTLLKGSV